MPDYWNSRCDVSALLGKTLTDVRVNRSDDRITFVTTDGEEYVMFHSQDCCETVNIDDIVGNVEDLVGNPLTLAEQVSSEDVAAKDTWDESFTWTFYRFATVKGYVNIKWYGTSNGYYSESVDFAKVT